MNQTDTRTTRQRHTLTRLGRWGITPSTARTLRACVLLAMVGVLQACTLLKPSWIEAPLVADGSSARDNSSYTGTESKLYVSPGKSAHLKFSYATLPKGLLPNLKIESGKIIAGHGSYELNKSKIANARLVLYVDRVRSLDTGPFASSPRGNIKIYDYPQKSPDCFTGQDGDFDCGPRSSLSERLALDADQSGNTVEITERGFYSFDVTDQIKNRFDKDNEIVLTVAYDFLRGDTPAEITLASSEQDDQSTLLHQPQLLISLKDAAGISTTAGASTSVLESSPNNDYSGEPNLWLSGASGDQANALIKPNSAQGVGDPGHLILFFGGGPTMFKQSLITFVNSKVAAPAFGQPRLDFYERNPRTDSAASDPVTWTNTKDDELRLIGDVTLKPGIPNQVVMMDIADSAVRLAGEGKAIRSVVVKTNAPSRFAMDSSANRVRGQVPRTVTVVAPMNWMSPLLLDEKNLAKVSYCVAADTDGMSCWADNLRRARVNQTFKSFAIGSRAENGNYSGGFAAAITLTTPLTGPSASLAISDFEPSGFHEHRQGYFVRGAKANNTVGKYQLIISMPGHNARGYVDMENLPLPKPTLSGPPSLQLPTGATLITVPTDATVPFRLNVVDPVNDNIDETTRWTITSSNSADTMPGEMQQTQGSVAFAAQFAGVGTRTLTVTSKGDATLTATLQVTVSGDVPPDLVGQTITFDPATPTQAAVGTTASVAATGGASGNSVVLTVKAASASVCQLNGTTVTFATAGTCTILANQAGNATYSAAPEASWNIAVTETGPPVLLSQAIIFTSTPPANPVVGGTYEVAATGGASNNPVMLSIASAGAAPRRHARRSACRGPGLHAERRHGHLHRTGHLHHRGQSGRQCAVRGSGDTATDFAGRGADAHSHAGPVGTGAAGHGDGSAGGASAARAGGGAAPHTLKAPHQGGRGRLIGARLALAGALSGVPLLASAARRGGSQSRAGHKQSHESA